MKRSYTVELRSGPLDDLTDEAYERFAEAILGDRRLAGPVPTAAAGLHALDLRTCVDASGAAAALTVAAEAFTRAARKASVHAEPEVASVWLDIEGVDFPDELVTGGEVARRLGISRERVRQLSESGRIPTPVAGHDRDRIWRWGDVAEWARLEDRKVSRRRKRAS